jgi:hypothetical protein
MRDVFLEVELIDRVFLGQRDIGALRTFEQFTYQRVFGDTLARRPGLRVKIPIHQELSEAEVRERNLPPYRPGFLDL